MADETKTTHERGQTPQNTAAGQQPTKGKACSTGKVCGQCGALLPDKAAACLVCGVKWGALPAGEVFPPPLKPLEREELAPRPSTHKSPEIWRRWATGLSGMLLSLIVFLAGLGVYRQYFDTSSYRAGEVVVYETSSGQLMLSYPSVDQPQRISGIHLESGNSVVGELLASANGRWIAYAKDNGELYLIDLAQQRLPGSNELTAAKVADGVTNGVQFATGSEYLVYLTADNELFASDFSERWRLDSNVTKIVGMDQRRVLYTRHGDNSDDDQVDLYLDYITHDGGEWLLIDRDVAQVLDWTSGFEQLLYTCVRQDASGKNVTWLNSFELRREGNATTQLVSGLGSVLDASAEKGTVVYLSPNTPEWDYDQFIDDDMAEEDTLVQKPDMAEYPLLAEAISIYGEAGDFSDIEDNEDLVEEQRLFNEATALWEQKQERDVLRMFYHNEFKRARNYAELYDLFVWRSGAVYQLDSGIWLREPLTKVGGQVDAEKNFVLYERIDPNSLKRMTISELWERSELTSFNPGEYFFKNTQRELFFSLLDGTPVRIYSRTGDQIPRQWLAAPKVDGIYFSVGSQNNDPARGDEFYFAPVKSGIVGSATRVGQQYGQLGQAFRDGLLFYGLDNKGIFYCHNGIALELGDKNSEVASLENDSATLLYYKDIKGDIGSLYMMQREEQLIAQDVSVNWKPWYRSDSLIYYAAPGKKADTMDLYMWQNGKTQLIQEDVQGVLHFVQLKPI